MNKMSKLEFIRKTIGYKQTQKNNYLKIKQNDADQFLIEHALKKLKENQRNGLFKRC